MRFLYLLLVLLLFVPAHADKAADLVKEGNKLMEAGKVSEAMGAFEQAIKLNPKCAAAYAARGQFYGVAGEEMAKHGKAEAKEALTMAIEDLTRAVTLNPKDAVAFLNRATCYYRLGDLSKALADQNRSLKLKPIAQAYRSRGQTQSKLGNDAAAVVDYTKAYELSKDVDTLFNRGNAYLRLNQLEKAKADYRTVIKSSKNPALVDGAKNNLAAAEEGRTK